MTGSAKAVVCRGQSTDRLEQIGHLHSKAKNNSGEKTPEQATQSQKTVSVAEKCPCLSFVHFVNCGSQQDTSEYHPHLTISSLKQSSQGI